MNEELVSSLNKNEKISDEFKMLAITCFGRIDFYLAKKKKGTCSEEELQNYEDRYKQKEKRYLEV